MGFTVLAVATCCSPSYFGVGRLERFRGFESIFLAGFPLHSVEGKRVLEVQVLGRLLLAQDHFLGWWVGAPFSAERGERELRPSILSPPPPPPPPPPPKIPKALHLESNKNRFSHAHLVEDRGWPSGVRIHRCTQVSIFGILRQQQEKASCPPLPLPSPSPPPPLPLPSPSPPPLLPLSSLPLFALGLGGYHTRKKLVVLKAHP